MSRLRIAPGAGSRRHARILFAAVVALCGAGVARSAVGAPSGGAVLESGCARGATSARIAGKHVCLKAGQRCRQALEGQYRRYRFHCRSGHLVRTPAKPPALPRGAHLVATIPLVPSAASSIAADAGGAWAYQPDNGFLYRIDAATNTPTRIAVQPTENGVVAAADGSVWFSSWSVASPSEEALYRLDTTTHAIVATIPMPDAGPEGIAFAAGSVWVAEHRKAALARIDAATNTVVATIATGSTPGINGPENVAASPSAVWVWDSRAGAVLQIDPATNAVVAKLPEGRPAFDGHSLWISGLLQVLRVDPQTDKIIATIPLSDDRSGMIAADAGAVWVSTATALVRIDPVTNKVVGRLRAAGGDVALGAGSVWLLHPNELLRIAAN